MAADLLSEHELVEAAKRGDEAAGAALVSLAGPRLMAYASSLLPGASLTDIDIVCERAIERAIAKVNAYDSSRASLATWLRSYVRFEALDFIRNSVQIRTDLLQLEEQRQAADTPSVSEEARASLASILDQLSESDQLIVRLRGVELLPYSEIAEVLGLSVATCRQRYSRAMARLRGLASVDEVLRQYVG